MKFFCEIHIPNDWSRRFEVALVQNCVLDSCFRRYMDPIISLMRKTNFSFSYFSAWIFIINQRFEKKNLLRYQDFYLKMTKIFKFYPIIFINLMVKLSFFKS